MSAATATLIAGGLAILGTLLGVMIERLLRLTGRLWLTSSDPSLKVVVGRNQGGDELMKDWREVEEGMGAERAPYFFFLDLFNGKEVPTGLRDVRLELVRDGGDPVRSDPFEAVTIHIPTSYTPTRQLKPLGSVLNLAPRQLRELELQGGFSEVAAKAIRDRRWRRVEFVGEFPSPPFLGILGSKTYRKTIIEPWA